MVEILGLTLAHGVFSGFLWWMQFGVGVCGLLTVWAGLSFFLAMKNRGDEEKEAAKLGHVRWPRDAGVLSATTQPRARPTEGKARCSAAASTSR